MTKKLYWLWFGVIFAYSLPILVGLGRTNWSVLWANLFILFHFLMFWQESVNLELEEKIKKESFSVAIALVLGVVITITVLIFWSPWVLWLTVIQFFASWIAFKSVELD